MEQIKTLNRSLSVLVLSLMFTSWVSAQCTGSLSVLLQGSSSGFPLSVMLSPSTTALTCSTPSATLTASGGTSYVWGDPAVPTSASTADAFSEGLYSVSTTDANGCTASNQVTITHSCNDVFEPAQSGPAAACDPTSVSVGVPVSGSHWTYLRSASGRVIAALNPNGFDMGLVRVQVKAYTTVPVFQGDYYLPRYFDFTVENQPPVAQDIQVRIFFTDTDLDRANAADPQPTATQSQLYMVHYNGSNTDCNLLNDDFTLLFAHIIAPGPVNDADLVSGASFYLDYPFPSFSEFGAKLTNNNNLPIELLYFNGRADQKDNVLEWSTASEQNSAYFDIERSSDNVVFKSIGQKPAAGTSTSTLKYGFKDVNAPNSAFYRLKSIDKDGSFAYSRIVYLERNGGIISVASVYPSPTSGTLNVDFSTQTESDVVFTLTDVAGKSITSQKYSFVSGEHKQVLDLSNFPAGTYLLLIDTEGCNRIVRKVVKDRN